MIRNIGKFALPALWACLLLTKIANAQTVPALAIDSPFAIRGGTVSLTVTGEPGAGFFLFLSTQPDERPLGAIGTLFLATPSRIGGGTLDGAGVGTFDIDIPDQASLENRTLYVQALQNTSPGLRLSNAVPFRVQSAPPAGRRVSLTVAATPDGTRAYVGHEIDGSVSVIDAVNDVKMTELPVTTPSRSIPYRPLDIGVDPEGRHAFVVNTAADSIAVIHTATDSVSAQIPVSKGNRRLAFDFSGGERRIYVTNQVMNAVLVFVEEPAGDFTQTDVIPLAGRAPGPIVVLPDGLLMVGHRSSLELEVIDPDALAGQTTVATIALGSSPFDLVISGSEVLVPTFVPDPTPGIDGANRVLRVSLADFQVTGELYENAGTDYVDVALAHDRLAVVAASTGTTLIADATDFSQLDNVELAPGDPTATPQDSAFITPAGGAPTKLYVVNYFRESVTPILVSGTPPFGLGDEIPLAWIGRPRVPLSGDLTLEENGDWFFRSVQLFGGAPFNPNPATCSTCHIDGATDNVIRPKQPPAMWAVDQTGPWGWSGGAMSLTGVVLGAIEAHNKIGTQPFPGAETLILAFIEGQPPESPYLLPGGALSQDAAAGKLLFEGTAGCSDCHAAPLFIPEPPDSPTIDEGIGTGLAPVNVPSLRGAWVTGPYLHDGSARTLMDVLTINPDDTHGMLAAPLTQTEREQLVEYLRTL